VADLGERAVRIGISGSYGGLNLGDEAILAGILLELRATVPSAELTVFSRDANDTRVRHRVERAVPVRELSRDEVRPEIARLDLLILGGGGILYDEHATTYLREVGLAQELGIPVVVYAVSVGPLHYMSAREAVRGALDRAAAVTVRDRRSKRLLEEVGVQREVCITADPALLLPAEPPSGALLARVRLPADRRLIGISVREPGPAAPGLDVNHYHELLANAADFMVERYDAALVFVPMEYQNDVRHSHAVLGRMTHARRATVLTDDFTAPELCSLMGTFEFVVGMRLHFLIFAALQRVPFLALPYGSKVSGFLEEFGMQLPQLDEMNAGRLIAYVDRAWQQRGESRARVDAVMPCLLERARESNHLVTDVLRKRSGIGTLTTDRRIAERRESMRPVPDASTLEQRPPAP
jgi:polysaccharide pyruvyl transferase CsaB